MTFVTSAQRHDVVSVGDVAMDVFIPIPEATTEVRIEEGRRRLVVPLGAKLPFDRNASVTAGGDAANAAVAFARLGLRSALAAFIAHDQYGRDLLVALRGEGVHTNLVHVDDPADTNRNFVLWSGPDRTILVRHQRFNWHWPSLRPNEVPAWLYLTSVGANDFKYEDEIAQWLGANPAVRLAFRPGTHQLEAGMGRLAELFGRCEVLVLSQDAAMDLLGIDDADEVLAALARTGARRLVLTDQDGGARAADAEHRYQVPPYLDTTPVYERTGSDDAFASTVVAGLIAGLSFRDALQRAPVNAMSVKHEVGAQAGLLRQEDLVGYLAEMPEECAVVIDP
ncbi:MAG TPA: PfkB family carbohydrate kinase [Acidimicrobiales bacterium]|nr:PfkB family carbohydrate kinase [Acidimicrobiales bacterium]